MLFFVGLRKKCGPYFAFLNLATRAASLRSVPSWGVTFPAFIIWIVRRETARLSASFTSAGKLVVPFHELREGRCAASLRSLQVIVR